MNNIIPFPKNPAEAREDKEMEALIWETMAYDDRTAAAVAQFVYDLDVYKRQDVTGHTGALNHDRSIK